MLHGDLQFKSARVFIQLADLKEHGQRGGPGPFDESNLGLQLVFVDWTSNWGKLRMGRQENFLGGGKKTGLREGPNQRRAFDEARFSMNLVDRGPLEFVYGREVQPNPNVFKDRSTGGPKLFGVWANSLFNWKEDVHLDLFYLSYERKNAIYNQGVGDEKRHSMGTRIWKREGFIQFDYEATYQFGNFASGDISAWDLTTETSFKLNDRTLQPRLGFKLNFASGDDNPNDNELGTYNALFLNPAYVSQAAIYAPGNGSDIQPFVEIHPHKALTLFTGIDFQMTVKYRK